MAIPGLPVCLHLFSSTPLDTKALHRPGNTLQLSASAAGVVASSFGCKAADNVYYSVVLEKGKSRLEKLSSDESSHHCLTSLPIY